jgi:hypothetical protein
VTATEERLSLSPEFVAKAGLEREGTGYVKGRIDAGDLRLDYVDAYDFGLFYAARHERALDLDELYAEFVAAHEERRAAEEDGAS